MARIFITGSSDGLGSLAARALVKRGHSVVLHARSQQRAKDALDACPGADEVLIGDLSDLDQTKALAETINSRPAPFDVIIHNAGLGKGPIRRNAQGVPAIIAVNSIAPYVLTALLRPAARPQRIVIVSSSLHRSGNATDSLADIAWQRRSEAQFEGAGVYGDTKLHNVLLANAIARRWRQVVRSSSLDPGWMPTKMGGRHAPGDLDVSIATYVQLAEGANERESGGYYVESREAQPVAAALSEELQDRYMAVMEEISGVKWPAE